MAAVSTTLAVAGLAVGGAGVYANMKGQEATRKQQEAQAEAQQRNTDIQNENQRKQAEFQAQAVDYQQEAEGVRQEALNLDSTRRMREVIRAGASAYSQGLAVATNQGATGAGNSAVPGGKADITGRTMTNLLGIRQARDSGQDIFDINSKIRGVYREAALAGNITTGLPGVTGSPLTSIGGGLTSLGGMMVGNASTVGKLFGGEGTTNPAPIASSTTYTQPADMGYW